MQGQLVQQIMKLGFDRSTLVKINNKTIEHLAQKWVYEPFLLPTWDSPITMDNNLELASCYFFFGNLINFGFTTDHEHFGPVGDTRFWLHLRSHPEFLNISNLLSLTTDHFSSVFGPIPYIAERVNMLKDSARVLHRMYNGKVSELYEANHWTAPGILAAMARDFSAFQDSAHDIAFLRRAILTLFMSHGRFQESMLFSKLETLPVAADSQLFQGLLQLGILEIEPELRESLKNGLVAADLQVVLRCHVILAAQTLLEQINSVRKQKIFSCHLDYFLRRLGSNGLTTISLAPGTMF